MFLPAQVAGRCFYLYLGAQPVAYVDPKDHQRSVLDREQY